MWNGIKVPSEFFWRTKFFPRAGLLCLVKCELPCVNPTSLRADRQWIIILKTFELVTLSFSQFHAQRNWLLTHALHFFNQYMRLLCCFWSLIWLRKKILEFISLFVLLDLLITITNLIFDLGLNVYTQVKFRRICGESSEHNWANISETICPEMLVFGK